MKSFVIDFLLLLMRLIDLLFGTERPWKLEFFVLWSGVLDV